MERLVTAGLTKRGRAELVRLQVVPEGSGRWVPTGQPDKQRPACASVAPGRIEHHPGEHMPHALHEACG